MKWFMAVLAACVVCDSAMSEILVEAESFAEKGGWVVDQQFTESMGSPYLMAHGLGRPVADAVAVVRIPKQATYRVWVRTKDWAPGDWDAPGRFRVLLNETALEPEFGTETGWAWQDGGTISLKTGDLTLTLHDLTGFDGRCDAIFLTSDLTFMPPNELEALRTWRRKLKGTPSMPSAAGEYDLVVVGGGIAGCAAALAADKQGIKVALIHDRPVLGGNASSEVRVHTLGITGKSSDILRQINTAHYPNGSPQSLRDEIKRHLNMEAAKNVELFLKWRAYGVEMDGKRIKSVLARHTESGREARFPAPVFVDSTGDGWIGFWAGADHRYGREASKEFDEGWTKHGDLWSPETPDNRVMGSSLLWYAKRVEKPVPFPPVPWATTVAGKHAAVKGEWQWEYSNNTLHQIEDAEAIRDHMLRAIYGSFSNARRNEKNAAYQLDFVSYISGKRESRRLMGDYIYTMRDATEGRDYPDAVVEEVRSIDVHYQINIKSAKRPDFLSEALFMKVPRYRIPFRCLYSRNLENLMMAGRCFSCSHIGLGGPRVMNTCGQMGVAVGNAAALCKKHKTTPRGVYQDHIKALRALIGYPSTVDTSQK